MVFVRYNGTGLDTTVLTSINSGSGSFTGNGIYYNTTTNNIDYYTSGSAGGRNYCFPIAIITMTDTTITSIDQVFNGFGYMGSTLFSLPGIKGLIPDGRNENGALKNKQMISSSVKIATLTSAYDWYYVLNPYGTPGAWSAIYYDAEKNVTYNSTHPDAEKIIVGMGRSGSNGKIELMPKINAFRAVGYNDFETLSDTVETNDDNAVHKTGDETIDGFKKFLRTPFRKISVDSTTTPNAYIEDIVIESQDTKDKLMSSLRTGRGSDGSAQTILYARKNNADGSQTTANLKVGVDGSGNAYAHAPTPAENSDSTNIATTAWVNNAAVHKTGNETISGVKTFSSTIHMQKTGLSVYNNSITKGTNPTSTQYWAGILWNDKTDAATSWQNSRLGYLEMSLTTAGSTQLSIGTYKNEANSTASSVITIGYSLTSGAWASAPNPPANSNNTNIATTAWVRSAAIGFLDYSKATKIESVPYTAPSNGFIVGGTWTDAETLTVVCAINGVDLIRNQDNHYGGYGQLSVPVAKGDVFTAARHSYVYFVPCKTN
jgi:hypothetical protein